MGRISVRGILSIVLETIRTFLKLILKYEYIGPESQMPES